MYPLAFGPSCLEAAFRWRRSLVSPSSRSLVGLCILIRLWTPVPLRGESSREGHADQLEK